MEDSGCSSAANDAGRNTAPLAKDVTLSASEPPAHIGTVLNASYRYVDTDGDSESGTLKVWLRNGKPIAGADQDNYTATLADSGKKLQFRVTPAAASGESPGAAVLSEELTIENSPPSVTNVVIGGSVNGQADGTAPLTVSYNFQDLDGDGEDAPTYEWRQNGKAIIGDERNKSYTLKQADAGTTLTVVVTPHARTGASPGLPVESNPVKVATPKVELSVSAGLKQLHFSWYPVKAVTKITYYRVSYNPDGVSGFVRLAKDSDNLTGTTYDWDIAVHRINWPKAQFMLEACDANNACTPSASISALNVMLGTIGYFKASNTGSYDTFGTSVALSGDGNTLAVGAPGEDSAATGIGGNQSDDCTTSQLNCATNSGAVYVYARSGGTWTQQAYVKASNTGTDDSFGTSVALSADGNTLAVGAWGEASAATGIDNTTPGPADNSFANAGAVYVYTRNNSSGLWSQQTYEKASNTGAADQFGRSVALSGDGHTLVVGASSEASANTGITLGAPSEATTGNGARFSGAVYVYSRSGITWTQQAYVKASNTEAGDFFGTSLALSGDGLTLAVGAYGEDSAATGINNTTPGPADNSVNAAGAVYV